LAPGDAGAAELMGLPSSLQPYDTQQLRLQAADRYQQKLVRMRKAKIRLDTYVDQVQIKNDSQGRAPVANKRLDQLAPQDDHRLNERANDAYRFGVGNIRVPGIYDEEHDQGAANNARMQIFDGPGMDRKRLKVIERLEDEHLRQQQHAQMSRARQEVKQDAVMQRIFKDQEQRVSNQEKEEQRLRRREARVAQLRARQECPSPVKLQQRKPFDRREHQSMDMRSILVPHSGEEQGAGCRSGGKFEEVKQQAAACKQQAYSCKQQAAAQATLHCDRG